MLSRVSSTSTRTRSKLSKWSSHSCHDRCGNVDFVLADCVVVSFDISHPGFFGILCKNSQSNHDIHELRSLVHSTSAAILNQILICYLTQPSISEEKVTMMIDIEFAFAISSLEYLRKISLSYTSIFVQLMI